MSKRCKTKYCGKKASKGSNYCSACRSRRYRANNPIKASYQNLRSNAKRRGKEFDLTFEQFKKFAIETEYIVGKGRSRTSYHIDRKDPEKGYTIDNIRVLENHENVRRHRRYLKFMTDERGVPCNFRVEDGIKISQEPDDNCPF